MLHEESLYILSSHPMAIKQQSHVVTRCNRFHKKKQGKEINSSGKRTLQVSVKATILIRVNELQHLTSPLGNVT